MKRKLQLIWRILRSDYYIVIISRREHGGLSTLKAARVHDDVSPIMLNHGIGLMLELKERIE